MSVRTRLVHLAMVAAMVAAGVGLAAGPAHAASTQSALLTIDLGSQFPGNVHVYDITIDPCSGAFSGVSNVADNVPAGETISGTLTAADGTAYFFKTHVEPDSVMQEYYNVELLESAGYPIIRPVYANHEPGRQIVVYPFLRCQTLFDVIRQVENDGADHNDIEMFVKGLHLQQVPA